MAEPQTKERGATRVIRYVLFNWLRRHSDINCRDDAVASQRVHQFWQGSEQAFQAERRLQPPIQSLQVRPNLLQPRPTQPAFQVQERPQQAPQAQERPQQAFQQQQRLQPQIQHNDVRQKLLQDSQRLQQLSQDWERLRQQQLMQLTQLRQARERYQRYLQAQQRPQQTFQGQESPLHFRCVKIINNRRYLLSLEKSPVTFAMQKLTVHTSRLTVPSNQPFKVSDFTVMDNIFNLPSEFWPGPYRIVYKIPEDYEYLMSMEITRISSSSVEQSISPAKPD